MKFLKCLCAAALVAAFFMSGARAQWQVPLNSVPVGQGAGTGFNFAGPGTNSQALFGNTGSAPAWRQPAFTDITGTLPNSQLATMPSSTVKANVTGGTAQPTDVPLSQLSSAHEVGASGAAGSIQTTTGSITTGTNSLTLAAAIDFKNSNGIRINHAGTAFATNPPTGASATPQGTPGSTTYNYQIASLDAAGGVGAAIAQFSTTTGNATLTGANNVKLTWSAPGAGPAPFAYAIYASCPSCAQHNSTMQLIALVAGGTLTYNDAGLNYVWTVPDWLPALPQGASLADWLVTSITSGQGTTTLALASNAGTTASSQLVDHDDTVAVQACINLAQTDHTRCHLAGGNYPISSTLTISGRMELFGDGIQGTQNYYYALQGAVPLTRSSAANAATIWVNSNANGIVATLNDAVQIHDFQIIYTSQPAPSSGLTNLVVSGTGGPYNVTQNCTTTNTSQILTACQDTRFMAVSEGIIGSGIPVGATITSIDSSTQIHISIAATASATTPVASNVIAGFNLTATTSSGSPTLTAMTNANLGITAGMVITGSCVPFGTTVVSAASTTVTMSANATCNGTQSENFAFGLMTNESIHDLLIANGDRLMTLANTTEFWVWNNKLYDGLTFSAVLDLDNGNGDWQWGPGNIAVAGSIYAMSHMWLVSGGGGRVIGNKFNTAGSINSTVTNGILYSPVRDFTSIEPPQLVGNSIEGLNAAVHYANSCTHVGSCQSSQGVITGNQMWTNTDIVIDNAGTPWVTDLVISGNALNVNGGGGINNISINNAQNILITGNIFSNTNSGGSTAIAVANCTNCVSKGNRSIGNTTLGTGSTSIGSFASCNSGSTLTNTLYNAIEAYIFGGTNIGAVSRNGTTVWGGANIAAQPTISILLEPSDTVTVTTSAGTCPSINTIAVNP